ncbi:Uncharacterised protein [Mycobacterium tuberculosis]|nr:Uncharacterised protein [Mycobacterium tuberculosis]
MWSQVCLLWQAVESVLAEQQPAGAAGTGRGPGFAGVAAVAAVPISTALPPTPPLPPVPAPNPPATPVTAVAEHPGVATVTAGAAGTGA